ncbi:MAG: hypothetical protein IPH53_15150 [Flavobacteriales bacterium]|nr:hypothetical protein [Flavobacteriales bacterium]
MLNSIPLQCGALSQFKNTSHRNGRAHAIGHGHLHAAFDLLHRVRQYPCIATQQEVHLLVRHVRTLQEVLELKSERLGSLREVWNDEQRKEEQGNE